MMKDWQHSFAQHEQTRNRNIAQQRQASENLNKMKSIKNYNNYVFNAVHEQNKAPIHQNMANAQLH